MIGINKSNIIGLCSCLAAAISTSVCAANFANNDTNNIWLQKRPSFFRFSFDNVKMPATIQNMGLLGINYFTDITPNLYAGVGSYGALTGTQGGLFTLGLGGGIHQNLMDHLSADAGLYIGGGGGRSSLVGNGLMLRPYAGLMYSWNWARIGVHYSYIDFPDGEIRSQQIGLDFDIPFNFYYVSADYASPGLLTAKQISVFNGSYLSYQRNDFGLLIQAYFQHQGTTNVHGAIQDGTIGLVGAELDHYITEKSFWWIKADGAFSGIPNGYMDVLGGLGYRWNISQYNGIAILPQFGLGAGGGGNVDTGGGVLIQPEISVDIPITSHFSGRVSGGYVWAPDGQLGAYTTTGELIYHLDVAAESHTPPIHLSDHYLLQNWRIFLFNQTYLHPQRAHNSITSPANLVAIQIDQLFTPHFFLCYQAASAYGGTGTGGLATGMIGVGLQSGELLNKQLHFFTEALVGAAGGGGLALSGGSIIEPVIGLHVGLSPSVALQMSIGQLKALQDHLNTPVINLGFAFSFGMLNRQ